MAGAALTACGDDVEYVMYKKATATKKVNKRKIREAKDRLIRAIQKAN